MTNFAFQQVDVFTTRPLLGNPPAVVVGATYVASQGTALGRSGRVHVERDGLEIWIGGAVTTSIAGFLTL